MFKIYFVIDLLTVKKKKWMSTSGVTTAPAMIIFDLWFESAVWYLSWESVFFLKLHSKLKKNFKCAQLFSVFLVGNLQMYSGYLGANLTLR